jgi:iron(III) transport system ATP-binding protein
VAADHLVVFPAPGSIAAQVNLGDSGVRRYSSAS